MILDYAQSLTELAEQLINKKFNRITAIAELMAIDSGKAFLDGIPVTDMIVSDKFVKDIPIVYENVSVKKYDYTLLTHVILWLADGEPYIYTPPPTIGYTRHGMQYNKLTRREHFRVPNNVTAIDVLTVTQQCEHDHPFDVGKSLNLTITRYKR